MTLRIAISTAALLLASCAHDSTPPAVSHVLDVYVEDDGFFVITERGTSESMAVRFNVHETHTREPKETP